MWTWQKRSDESFATPARPRPGTACLVTQPFCCGCTCWYFSVTSNTTTRLLRSSLLPLFSRHSSASKHDTGGFSPDHTHRISVFVNRGANDEFDHSSVRTKTATVPLWRVAFVASITSSSGGGHVPDACMPFQSASDRLRRFIFSSMSGPRSYLKCSTHITGSMRTSYAGAIPLLQAMLFTNWYTWRESATLSAAMASSLPRTTPTSRREQPP